MPGQGINVSQEKKKSYIIDIFITIINATLYWKGYRFFFLLVRNVKYILVGILFKMRTLVVGRTGARKSSVRGGARSY